MAAVGMNSHAARLPRVRGAVVETSWEMQFDDEGRPFYFCPETKEVRHFRHFFRELKQTFGNNFRNSVITVVASLVFIVVYLFINSLHRSPDCISKRRREK